MRNFGHLVRTRPIRQAARVPRKSSPKSQSILEYLAQHPSERFDVGVVCIIVGVYITTLLWGC